MNTSESVSVFENATEFVISPTVEFENETDFGAIVFDGKVSATTWIIVFYIAFVSVGAALNFLNVCIFLCSKRDGTWTVSLQISAVDILLTCVGIEEILIQNGNITSLSSELCQSFQGTEVLINTVSSYLLISLNIHIISLLNLHENQLMKYAQNPLTTTRSDESNECLVSKSETAKRVQIDYQKRQKDVCVVLPTIFVWTVCLSLSIPNYIFSSILQTSTNETICAIVDVYYSQLVQNLMLLFRFVIPISLLIITLIILIFKLWNNLQNKIENLLTKQFAEIRSLLILAIVLTCTSLFTSTAKQSFHSAHIILHQFCNNDLSSFKMPPLYNDILGFHANIAVSILHYSGTALRSGYYLYLLPNFKDVVKRKLSRLSKKSEEN